MCHVILALLLSQLPPSTSTKSVGFSLTVHRLGGKPLHAKSVLQLFPQIIKLANGMYYTLEVYKICNHISFISFDRSYLSHFWSTTNPPTLIQFPDFWPESLLECTNTPRRLCLCFVPRAEYHKKKYENGIATNLISWALKRGLETVIHFETNLLIGHITTEVGISFSIFLVLRIIGAWGRQG